MDREARQTPYNLWGHKSWIPLGNKTIINKASSRLSLLEIRRIVKNTIVTCNLSVLLLNNVKPRFMST